MFYDFIVLLPYRFTLFSNGYLIQYITYQVLLPYRFTLFSNNGGQFGDGLGFYYLIDLHYSQTNTFLAIKKIRFYYLIDLHYSQTSHMTEKRKYSFTTL